MGLLSKKQLTLPPKEFEIAAYKRAENNEKADSSTHSNRCDIQYH